MGKDINKRGSQPCGYLEKSIQEKETVHVKALRQKYAVCSKGSVAGVEEARGEYEEMRSERKGGVSIWSLSGNHKDFISYCEDREVITSFEQRNTVV